VCIMKRRGLASISLHSQKILHRIIQIVKIILNFSPNYQLFNEESQKPKR